MATLDTAPAEVLHAICALLLPKDVAAFRSASTVLANIGAHYLVRQVKFHTSQASLDRLQAIAEHKVFSQYIEAVHFEANLLANICCRDAWNEQFEKHGHGARSARLEMPKPPKSPSSVRENRLYARNYRKWKDNVNAEYDKYRGLYEEQRTVHQQAPVMMAEIMPLFPRLRKVTFTIGRCPHVLSKRFLQEFDSDLGYCAPLSVDTAATGLQLKHIILPGGSPLGTLQTLVVTDLDPSLFEPSAAFSTMCHAFANLKKLDISFRLPDSVEPSTEPGLYKVLKKGGLRNAISSATGLEELRVAFHDYTYDGPCVELKNVLGEKSFANLKKLSLGYVEADTKSLIETLKRQKSLKYLAVNCMSIIGSWVDALDKMQKDLALKHATFDGFLVDDEQMYDMEYAEVDHYMEYQEEFTIGTAMSMYATDSYCEEEPNPLDSFNDEYADRETLSDMWHEMIADMSDDCECDDCIASRELEFEESDESMPDLQAEDSDTRVHPMLGTFGPD